MFAFTGCKVTHFFLHTQIYYVFFTKLAILFVYLKKIYYFCKKITNNKNFLEMENRRFEGKNEPEIVYSRAVKAGKRIYYLDVKKARNEDLYLCITESKRKQTGEAEPPQFEKHKVFLYKEDFAHFTEGLNDVISFVQSQLGAIEGRKEWNPETDEQVAPETKPESNKEEKSKRGLLSRLINQ